MAHVGNAFENSCILTALGVVAILLNICVITRFGRRQFFLTMGLILCGISQITTAAIYDANPRAESTGKAIVGLSVIFILGYNVSLYFAQSLLIKEISLPSIHEDNTSEVDVDVRY